MRFLIILFILAVSNFAYSKNINQQIDNFLNDEGNKTATHSYENAQIIAINKATGESKVLKMFINQTSSWRDLLVKVVRCIDPPYESVGGKQAEIVLWDSNLESSKPIFHDWFFQHQPAVSTFQHSKYDILLEECFDHK